MRKLTINVIGAGRIGSGVIDYINESEELTLGRVLTRSGSSNLSEPSQFFSSPSDIIIETAGPDALRAYGQRALEAAEVWTVSGGVLADDSFRDLMIKTARNARHHLRLFSHWIAGADHAPADGSAKLHITQCRPGAAWSGALSDAAKAYPDTVNSAVSAALCGAGMEASSLELKDPGANGGHRFQASVTTVFGRFDTDIDLGHPEAGGPHPTAAAIIAALRREVSPIQYG